MKAALSLVVDLVNVALFLLSATVYGPLAMVVVSLASWWWLSDFYCGRWRWWTWELDRLAFIGCALLVLLALAVGTRRFLRRVGRRLAPQYALFAGAAEKAGLPLRGWYEHMGTIAGFRPGLWSRYWTWRRRRLESLRASSKPVVAGRLATVWWLRPTGLTRWGVALLFPAFWAALVLVPLHTNAMEHVAAWATDLSPAISSVRCTGLVGNTAEYVNEELQHDPTGFYRSGRCFFLGDGEFEIISDAFPRVYRHYVVRCVDRCTIAPEKGAGGVPAHWVPMVGGRASFEWAQRKPDPQAGLGMSVTLARQDNATLDQILIEP